MRESHIFGDDCNEFNPDRDHLMQATPFNAIEQGFSGFCKKGEARKHPTKYRMLHPRSFHRYCTGHDIALFVCNNVIDQLKPQPLYERRGTADEVASFFQMSNRAKSHHSAEVMKILDPFTKLTSALFSAAAKAHNKNPPKAEDVQPPTIYQPPCEILPQIGKFLPIVAEENGRRVFLKDTFLKICSNQKLVEFNERKIPDRDWESVDFAVYYRETYFKQIPVPNVKFTELVSNRAMTQFGFYGLACQHMRKLCPEEDKVSQYPIPDGAVYIHDMSVSYSFDVRPGYEKYGAIAYFNDQFEIVGIYWCHGQKYIPAVDDCKRCTTDKEIEQKDSSIDDDNEDDNDDEEDEEHEQHTESDIRAQEWAHAKWCWKTTSFAHVAVEDHLIWTHFMEANHFVLASQHHLPINHPLRLFLRQFQFNTVDVNYTAMLGLVNKYGFIHRLWAFEYDEVVKIFQLALMKYKFRILPEFIHPSMRDLDDKYFPYCTDSLAFWCIMRKYVSSFVNIYYKTDTDLMQDTHAHGFCNALFVSLALPSPISTKERFVDVITQLMCSVTANHEHVGQVSDYVLSPDWVGTKLKPNKNVCQVQNYVQFLTLTLMTGLRNPGILADFSHLIPDDEHREQVVQGYRQWKQDLHDLVNAIDVRNETRIFPFESFNPRVLECSVSV
jgi:hypothetical protein